MKREPIAITDAVRIVRSARDELVDLIRIGYGAVRAQDQIQEARERFARLKQQHPDAWAEIKDEGT